MEFKSLFLVIALFPLVIRSQGRVKYKKFKPRNDYLGLSEYEEYCGGKPADVVFLLDASNSIWGPDFKKQLEFVQNIVSMFNIGENYTQVGMATFNRHTDLQFHLNTYHKKEDLIEAIGLVEETYGDATNTADAVRFMRREMFSPRHGSRKGVPRVGVIITDGQSSNILRTVFQASRAKRQHINLFAIGVGDLVNARELRGIASKPSMEYMFQVLGYGALGSVRNILAVRTCAVSGKPKKLTTPVFVRRTTTTTTTTTPPPPKPTERTMLEPACRNKKADIVFAIDSSNGINRNDYWQQIRFVREVARRMDIGENKTRVGLIVYTDQVLRQFDLSDHTNMKPLLEAIISSRRSAGGTRIDNAVRYVRTKSFRRSLSRPGAAQVAVFIAGSKSRNIHKTKKEAGDARSAGMTLFSIGVGKGYSKDEMHVISKGNKGWGRHGYFVDDFDQIETIIKDLTIQACRTKPTETPLTNLSCGFRQQADLMFVVDSANAGRTNTKKTLEFVRDVSKSVDIDQDNVHVGLMSAGCDAGEEGFSLGAHRNEQAMKDAISRNQRGTDISKLLKDMRRNSFSSKEGGRKDAKKVAVVVVDGQLEQPLKALREARFARIRGVEVYVVAVGNGEVQKEIEMMCDDPLQKHFFRVENYDQLKGLKTDLVDMFCDEL
ncbi:collagen alpha-1(XII) chain isoform X5 [Patella vulgata]|uniref:collagen alpha-1(XII) chain isoform X5 n=1 Tax=Patella vulgata TaxID=6465 RepID=UPI00217FADF0|nr:collagen alpha-1(XII) chain isoform X5 [Patella vulgata]